MMHGPIHIKPHISWILCPHLNFHPQWFTISTVFCNIKTSLNVSYVSASRSKDLFYHKNICVSVDKYGFYSEVGTEFLCIIQLNFVAKL